MTQEKSKITTFNKTLFRVSLVLVCVLILVCLYFHYLLDDMATHIELLKNFEIDLATLNIKDKYLLKVRGCANTLNKISFFVTLTALVSNGVMLIVKHRKQFFIRSSILMILALGILGYRRTIFFDSKLKTFNDNNGVEWFYYGKQIDTHIGFQRNPLFVASQAIAYHKDFKKTGDSQKLIYFHNCINFLMEDKVEEGSATYYTGDFYLVAYDEPIGWKCGLTNSRVILAMIEAHEESNDSKYLKEAHNTLVPFTIPITKGGLNIKLSEESWWFCEYPKSNGKSPMVLNGMLSILIAMHKYYDYSGDPLAKDLYDKGIIALKQKLSGFDDNGFSFYDLKKKSAGKSYHMIHISLLKQLYEFQPDYIFEEYRKKWSKYATDKGW